MPLICVKNREQELKQFLQDNQKGETVKQQNSKEPLSKRAGNKIERLGEKISNAGAKKIGNAVRNMGEKLERSQDHKRKNL